MKGFALVPCGVPTSTHPPASSVCSPHAALCPEVSQCPQKIDARCAGRFFFPCLNSCCLRELRFTLLKQRLLELVRKGETDEALTFAAERLAPEGAGDPVTLRQVEEAVTLLAFEVRRCFGSCFLLQHPPYIEGGRLHKVPNLRSEKPPARMSVKLLAKLSLKLSAKPLRKLSVKPSVKPSAKLSTKPLAKRSAKPSTGLSERLYIYTVYIPRCCVVLYTWYVLRFRRHLSCEIDNLVEY